MVQMCLFSPDEEILFPELPRSFCIVGRRYIHPKQLCLHCDKEGYHDCSPPMMVDPVTWRSRIRAFLEPRPRVFVTAGTTWEKRGGYSVGSPVRVKYGWRRVLVPFFNRNKKPWQI